MCGFETKLNNFYKPKRNHILAVNLCAFITEFTTPGSNSIYIVYVDKITTWLLLHIPVYRGKI
jgi:hypothetical protein